MNKKITIVLLVEAHYSDDELEKDFDRLAHEMIGGEYCPADDAMVYSVTVENCSNEASI